MKSKICVLLIISLLTCISNAQTSDERKLSEEKNMQLLEQMGLPAFNSGIKIVPRELLGLPKDILKKGHQQEKQIKKLGYLKTNTNRPGELLNFQKNASIYLKTYVKNTNDESTHLRKNIKDLKLAFQFDDIFHDNSLLMPDDITLIGVAPKGSFNEEAGGWSGATQFFEERNIGTCSYAVMNVKASGTSALLAMEDVTYDVNNKATLMLIEGNEKHGFIYKVEWYDNVNFHELECANMKYSQDITDSIINLAKKIDR